MASIKSIGFDMDHTLALYNREAFESLAFVETLKKFIGAGYPEELLELEFDPNFVIRGLLVDTDRGNLLKVDGHKYVKRAFHGHVELDKTERHRIYNAESYKADKFLSIDTFFALSEVQLYCEIVEYMRVHPQRIEKTFREVYQDLRRFIDLSHADGTIKSKVMGAPDKYFVNDKSRHRCLARFLEGGKSLFLLTNSKWDYTDAVMSYLYNDSSEGVSYWKEYFDYVIVGAAKPAFFAGAQPFYEVITDTGLLRPHEGFLDSTKVYQGGNCRTFQKLREQKGDEILYCGDHIYGDIIQSKEEFNWRTLLVIEELGDVLKEAELHRDDWEAASELLVRREEYDEEVQKIRSRIQLNHKQLEVATLAKDQVRAGAISKKIDRLDFKLKDLDALVVETDLRLDELLKQREARIHSVWGDPLRVGFEKSRLARQIEEYACLYTSDIANLRFYSPFKKFQSVHDKMPHDT